MEARPPRTSSSPSSPPDELGTSHAPLPLYPALEIPVSGSDLCSLSISLAASWCSRDSDLGVSLPVESADPNSSVDERGCEHAVNSNV